MLHALSVPCCLVNLNLSCLWAACNDDKTPTKPKFSYDLTLHLLMMRAQADYRIFRNVSAWKRVILQGFTAVTLRKRQLCRNTFIRLTSPWEGTVGLRRKRQRRLSHVDRTAPARSRCVRSEASHLSTQRCQQMSHWYVILLRQASNRNVGVGGG